MKLSKGLIVLFLASTFKVYVAENYTKMYLIELEFENSVYSNITEVLRNHPQIGMSNALVSEINTTTDCKLSETQKNCYCTPQNTWRDDICKAYACCKNESCLIKVTDSAVCLSNKRVRINGFTKWKNESVAYNILLDESKKQTDDYKKRDQEVIDELKKTFSKLLHFDSLTIDHYRPGSVIVDFTVQLLGSVTSNDLVSVAKYLNNSELTTTGLVDITILPEKQPIDLGSTATITCRPAEYLGQVKWYLDVQNKTTEITAGKEASLTKGDNLKDILTLKGISGSWKGTFKCEYTKDSIKHTASKQLDIALLPEITAMSTPQFPDCRHEPFQKVDIECKISDNKEDYTVTWNTTSEITPVIQDTKFQNNFISYKAKVTVLCGKEDKVYVNCTFTNNRATSNKLKMEKVEIPIITADSALCQKDGVWPDTKSGYTAKLPCANYAVGWKTRECTKSEWKKEISSCVNVNLHVIQKDIEELNKGIGFIKDNAVDIFKSIKESTTTETFNSFANIKASVNIFDTMNDVSKNQSNQWNDTVMSDFVNSVSNLLNKTDVWKNPQDDNALSLSTQYLQTIERIVTNSNLTMGGKPYKQENVELHPCNGTCTAFNGSVTADSGVVVVGFRNLNEILKNSSDTSSETTILSVTTVNNTNVTDIVLTFDYSKERLPNHEMFCVFWDEKKSNWSEEGCEWGGANNAELCTCRHNSAFTILMSKNEVTLLYLKELTYVGLGISIVSLVLCLIIEILIWDTVVKSPISNFRHAAIFNICLCLLLAHIAFLASAEPKKLNQNWCSILTLVKHFFFLAVFFWMLCLSFVILHQIIFVFENLRKKVFIILSITVGYVCPILCVAVTYISYGNGVEGQYYNKKTCWLKYESTLKGSIYAFILPVGTIVFINLFTLAVVIMKIVTPTVSEAKARDEKDVAKSMIKTIVFLSPVLGITWIFGFFIMNIDLTTKPLAEIINYTFTILNSLQGFFILLTNCIGEKKIRDALQKRFKGSKQSANSKSENSTKATTSSVNKERKKDWKDSSM